MLNPINMTAFDPRHTGQHINIIETGRITNVISWISSHPEDQQLVLCLESLAQTLRSPGEHQDTCAKELQARIFSYTKRNPKQAMETIKRAVYKTDPNLSKTIRKVEYLAAGLFGYHNRITNYVRRFFHHLGYEPYFLLGVTLTAVGITGLRPRANFLNKKNESSLAVLSMRVGWTFMLYSISMASIRAIGDEPFL